MVLDELVDYAFAIPRLPNGKADYKAAKALAEQQL